VVSGDKSATFEAVAIAFGARYIGGRTPLGQGSNFVVNLINDSPFPATTDILFRARASQEGTETGINYALHLVETI